MCRELHLLAGISSVFIHYSYMNSSNDWTYRIPCRMKVFNWWQQSILFYLIWYALWRAFIHYCFLYVSLILLHPRHQFSWNYIKRKVTCSSGFWAKHGCAPPPGFQRGYYTIQWRKIKDGLIRYFPSIIAFPLSKAWIEINTVTSSVYMHTM